jgi:hypothetical protein
MGMVWLNTTSLMTHHHHHHPPTLHNHQKSGMMDRAAEHIRRCLFTFEAAYSDGFRSAVTGGTGGGEAGLARLDSRRPENRPFFTALFRHVQMVGACVGGWGCVNGMTVGG